MHKSAQGSMDGGEGGQEKLRRENWVVGEIGDQSPILLYEGGGLAQFLLKGLRRTGGLACATIVLSAQSCNGTSAPESKRSLPRLKVLMGMQQGLFA